MDQTLPVASTADLAAEIAPLARRYKRANGPVIRLVNRLGGTLEHQLSALPQGVRNQLEKLTAQALEASYGIASRAPDLGTRAPMMAAVAAGAAGGAGGLATAVAELPVTVTLFLNTIRSVAREAGLDPDEDWVRAECLQVFAAGSPLAQDDGVNTSFLASRLALTGSTAQNLIRTIAPRLAAVLGQKLAAQAVPVIGAVSGAALNAAFLSYYREIARVRFELVKLGRVHGAEAVEAEFRLAVTPPKVIRA
ncbi:EcsC family protein [Tabrizicola sp.]|uniref:EcsC family protein n=1 Tax=Tabrizicola sp. TaxID=2005166 RepID=UPI001A628EB5|nr:EcsC family protein [Tabrizicola sp.]MBL9075452.1 EcsC family protein [Tabrizicola sp.]